MKTVSTLLLAVIGLAVSVLMSPTFAQTPSYQILRNAAEVAKVIHLATREVLITTDILRGEEVAEALREAIVVRGVPVFILVPKSAAEENASYIAGLAHAGASVRLAEVGGSFLVVDRRYTIAGSLIGSLGDLTADVPTILIDDPSYAAQFVAGFRQGFEAAQPYTAIGQ